MKKLNLLLLVLTLSFGSVLSANTDSPFLKSGDPNAAINMELTRLLADPDLILEKDIVAHVLLTVNKDNELVVLSVDTENELVKNFIKYRLNYKKIESTLPAEIREYKLPVRIKA